MAMLAGRLLDLDAGQDGSGGTFPGEATDSARRATELWKVVSNAQCVKVACSSVAAALYVPG
jgi:hypothetical protein